MRAQSGHARVVFHSISFSTTPSTGLGSILACPDGLQPGSSAPGDLVPAQVPQRPPGYNPAVLCAVARGSVASRFVTLVPR